MKLLLWFPYSFALMLAIYFRMSAAPEPLQKTSAIFILDYVDKWKIKYPKVFIEEGGKVSVDLWLRLSSRSIQAVVGSPVANVTHLLEAVKKDMATMEVFVSGNYSTVRCFLQNVLKSTLLNYHSRLILICHDCANNTELHLSDSHDILGDVTIAIPNELDERLFNLYGLTYDYRSRCLKRVELGHWSLTDGFHMTTTNVAPNGLWIFKYNNAILKVLIVEVEPYLFKYDDETGKLLPRGPLGELLNIISKTLQFKFKIKQSIHWGYGEMTKYGNFTMGIGEFVQDNYDLGLGVYSLTPHRKCVVDFTTPYFYSEVTFFFRENHNDKSAHWKTTFRPFTTKVWVAFAMTSLLLTLILRIASSKHRHAHVAQSPDIWKLGINGLKETNSTRIIVATFYILFFAFCSYYTAVLISAFTTDTAILIRTLQDLAVSDYSIITTNGTNMKEVFQTSANPSIKLLHTKNKIITVYNLSTGYEMLCYENKMAYVGSVVPFKKLLSLIPNCTLYPMKEIPFMDGLHLITQKKQMLAKRISAAFIRLSETGILHRIFKNEKFIFRALIKSEPNNKQRWAEISIHHLEVPFGILAMGIAMSIVALLLETIFAHSCCRPRSKTNRNPKQK